MKPSSSRQTEWIASIQLERFHPPLTCYFANCDEIWLRELAGHLNLMQPAIEGTHSMVADQQNIRFETGSWPNFVRSLEDGGIPPGSLVILGDRGKVPNSQSDSESNAEVLAKQFHILNENGVMLALVGNWTLAQRTAAHLAGVVAVVTDLSQCDKLAGSIKRAAKRKKCVLVEWKDPFLDRIPWPA